MAARRALDRWGFVVPRVNVYLSDELAALVVERLANVNYSKVLAAGLRALLECRHDELECSACGHGESRRAIESAVLDRFYRDVLWELWPVVSRVGTAEGAARVMKRVAGAYQVPSARTLPLPRPSRSQRERSRVLDFPDPPPAAPPAVLERPREEYLA